MKLKEYKKGYTLTELMSVVFIIGILILTGVPLLDNMYKNIMLSKTRLSLQQDARNFMAIVTKFLREAKSSTVVISRHNSLQPYYSKLEFSTIDGKNFKFYQDGRKIIMQDENNIRILSNDLRYLAFAFPESSNLSIISISVTLERDLFSGRKKALHMASEKVMVMNE